jgi:hypothetical protein
MTEMKEKFDFWFAIAMSNDSSKLAFAGDELDTVENGDKIIYEALHKRGLLDNKYYNIMEEVKKKKEKTARDADPATIKAKAEAETAQKAKTEAETNK